MSWQLLQPRPSLVDLRRHYDRYGMDKRYTTYRAARVDPVLEVARFFLERGEYKELVEHIGGDRWYRQVDSVEGWDADTGND